MRHQSRAFTLIEMLITLAVIAILAGIAMPAYQDYVRQSRRIDGQTALLNLQMAGVPITRAIPPASAISA